MFAIKNIRTGRIVKDAISMRKNVYESREEAELKAHGLNRFAAVGEKRDVYVVVKA